MNKRKKEFWSKKNMLRLRKFSRFGNFLEEDEVFFLQQILLFFFSSILIKDNILIDIYIYRL